MLKYYYDKNIKVIASADDIIMGDDKLCAIALLTT